MHPQPTDAAHVSAAEREAGAVLTIDLAAIRANYRLLRALAGPADCAAVVKADAYGLGAAEVLPALIAEGCRTFFTAHWSEARALLPLAAGGCVFHVLNGLMPGAEAAAAADAGPIVPVLNSLAQARAWAAAGGGRRMPAALHLDTGLSRLGFSPAESAALLADPALLARLDLKLLVSHLACADEPDNPMNARQLAALREGRRAFPGLAVSFANSSGIFLGRDYHFEGVRAGAALYGVNPTPAARNPMRQAVRLEARVIQLRDLVPGDRVGYGGEFTVSTPLRAATVGLGYGDGWPRRARTAAFFGGRKLPVLGRVSMDTIVLDVSALPPGELRPGRPVEFLGAGRTVDDLARDAGTIGYEILTGLGRRPLRRWVDAGAAEPPRG